jgi:hypothetical protein
MKIKICFLLLCMAQISGVCGSDPVVTEQEREAQQVQLWEERLHAAAEMPPTERIEHLWNGLRSMAWRISNTDQSPDVDALYYKIQKTLLATPGHAQHLAKKIEEARSEGVISRDAYRYLNETLVHLPSPESVAVLGHYLNDERDKPSPTPPSGTCGARYPGTFMLAFEGLSKIGLRDLPVTDLRVVVEKPAPGEKWTEEQLLQAELKKITASYLKQLEALRSYRNWWEGVKSGQHTFSFKGQALEYRFRPDGTWETIPIANPPDDGPKPVPAAPNSGKRDESPATVDSLKPADRSRMWWIAGVGVVLLAVAIALFRKFGRAG